MPREIAFHGLYMPTMTLNFSRPGAQVLLQYYLFLRLGHSGYTRVQQSCLDVAQHLADGIGALDCFELWSDRMDIPAFAWQLAPGYTDRWNLHHLSERLRIHGWQVPAYPMPDNLTDVTVQRVVVRNGFSRELADALLRDIQTEVTYLEKLTAPMPPAHRAHSYHH